MVVQLIRCLSLCLGVRKSGLLVIWSHITLRGMTCVSGNNIVSVTTITDRAEQGGSDGQLFGVGREAGPSSNPSRVTLSCQRTTITNAIREYVTTDV